jgi:hypothetical protein
MAKGGSRNATPVQPIRLAAAILSPCHFFCVLIKQVIAYPMMDTSSRASAAILGQTTSRRQLRSRRPSYAGGVALTAIEERLQADVALTSEPF